MRKNTQLTIAYIALFTAALGCIVQDANARSNYTKALSEAEKMVAARNVSGETKSRTPQYKQTYSETSVQPKSAYNSPAKTESSSSQMPELPRGVYLIKENLTAHSTEGVKFELEAGTAVSLMRREDGKMKVSLDGNDFVLDEKLLTRNSKSVSRLVARKS